MKKSICLLALLLAGAALVHGETVVYENDFESYALGEVRKPAQDAVPYMEYGEGTNYIYCEIEANCGVDETKGLHSYLLKVNGKSPTGSAQFNTGIDPALFKQNCEVCYSIDWAAASNLASFEMTDGTNLFFRLYANGGTARRIGVTNLATYASTKKTVELTGDDGDPSKVTCSSSFFTYVVHVLFPEGRITTIEKYKLDGTLADTYPQTSLFGVPGVLPTHFGSGIRGRSYGANDRNCYADNLKVSYEVLTQPKLGVSGVTRIKMQDSAPVLNINNEGTGTLTATVEVLSGSGFFYFQEDTEQAGTFVVETTDSATLHPVIDREVLGNAFGRAKVRVSGAGDEKILDYTIQGGSDEEGYTLYASDFEDLDLGDILVSDPLWVKSGTVEGCEVVNLPQWGQCLKIQTAQALHLNVNMPKGLSDKFDVKVSSRLLVPEGSSSSITYGTDLSHRMGEYKIIPESGDGNLRLSLENCSDKQAVTNRVDFDDWFEFSYVYSTSADNRLLRKVTFGDCEYELDMAITAEATEDNFNQFRNYTWTKDVEYYIDDFKIELVPRGQGKPPVVKVQAGHDPVSYTEKSVELQLFNDGGGSYNYTAEVVEGSDYLKLSKSKGEVISSDSITISINRSKMGLGFYVGQVKITTDVGVEEVINLHVQSGSATQGYILYQSDFNSLQLTTEEEGQVVNEISAQDSCWLPTSSRNRADVVADPDDPSNLCVSIREARRDSKGYHVALNVPAEACENFDVAYSMRIRIPESYVDGDGQTALFCIGQDDASRQCEVYLYLDEEDLNLPVGTDLHDLYDTEWWDRVKDTIKPISHDEWFDFRLKFNCKTYDYFYKELRSYTFGENEFHFEGEDAQLGKDFSEKQLLNEALAKVKFWSYKYDAGILVDDMSVALVPKGVPEPAFLGLLALAGLLFLRRK